MPSKRLILGSPTFCIDIAENNRSGMFACAGERGKIFIANLMDDVTCGMKLLKSFGNATREKAGGKLDEKGFCDIFWPRIFSYETPAIIYDFLMVTQWMT